MRPDTTPEALAKLPPYFRKDGVVTAGNASGICDGAAALVVAGRGVRPGARAPSARAAGRLGRGRRRPDVMGIGPVPASRRALARAGLALDDMDLIEINEAFAAQYLAVEQELGLDRERTNVDGGAVALGHPLGASGARITAAPAPRPAPPRRPVRPGRGLHRRRPGRRGGGGSLSRLRSHAWSCCCRCCWRAVVYSFVSLRVVRQYERGVAFFLGRFWGTKGPGLIFLPAGFATQKRVSLRIMALDIPPQDVITRDNVSVKVNAVLYMRVTDPAKAIIEIEDYLYATSQLAQTTLRSVLGEVELDELLSDREKINAVLKKIIDERTDPWGIEVSAVEVKDVDLPDQMKRAMARQAEAERERRAKVIAAQGELQASETLAQAAPNARDREPSRHPAPLPPDGHRDRRGEQLDHDLPHPDRAVQAVPRRRRPPARRRAQRPMTRRRRQAAALPAGDLSNLMSQLRLGAARTPAQD